MDSKAQRLTGFHWRLAVILGLVLFVDGYDLFNAGYVAVYLRKAWGLGDRQIGLMLSTGIAGLAAGAYVQAPVARLIGRRAAVAFGCVLLALASLSMATWVRDFSAFLALRLLLGVSLGMLSPLVFVYLNEWAPAGAANRFAALAFVIPFSCGGIAAGLASLTIGPVYGWRGLYWVAGIGLPIALACRWLPQARATERAGGGFTALFSPRYRGKTLGIWVASALSLLCLHGLSGWLPSLLVAQGQAFASAFGFGTLLMAMQIVGGLFAGTLADRFGRRSVIVWGFVGSALAMLLMGTAIGNWWLAPMVGASGFFIFGTQALMNNYTAMAYDPALRTTGTGAAVAFSRIGGVVGPMLIGWSRSLGGGLWTTFVLLAVTQIGAAAIVLWLRYTTENETETA